MGVLSREKIVSLMEHHNIDERLIISPLLNKQEQIGFCTVDLRLGTKFKVDLKTRAPYIDPLQINERPIETFFEETYRNFGEKFLLYPNQLVLGSTFEYVRLPKNIFGMLITRSSWNRLGLNISSIVQPGYAGVLTLELMNNSSNPIALYPGIRFAQLFLFDVEEAADVGYLSHSVSKYIANAEPRVSNISSDKELEILREKFKSV